MNCPPDPLWRDCAEVAMGVLRWPPETFWRATPTELAMAIRGLGGNGGSGRGSAVSALSLAELDVLVARFPDGV